MSSSVPTYLALIIASLSLGYWAGVGSTLTISRSDSLSAPNEAAPAGTDGASGDSSPESDEERDEGLSSVVPTFAEECKLVLVVRTDLGMSTGKIAAQCSHATLACYKTLSSVNRPLLRHWERTGQTKIALRCESEDDLLLLQATAKSLNLCARSIQDAGRTQVKAGSRTVLGIGPAPVRLINQVTGKLKLL